MEHRLGKCLQVARQCHTAEFIAVLEQFLTERVNLTRFLRAVFKYNGFQERAAPESAVADGHHIGGDSQLGQRDLVFKDVRANLLDLITNTEFTDQEPDNVTVCGLILVVQDRVALHCGEVLVLGIDRETLD